LDDVAEEPSGRPSRALTLLAEADASAPGDLEMKPVLSILPLLLGLFAVVHGGCGAGDSLPDDATDVETKTESSNPPGTPSTPPTSPPTVPDPFCPSGQAHLQIYRGSTHGNLEDTWLTHGYPTYVWGDSEQITVTGTEDYITSSNISALLKVTVNPGAIPVGATIVYARLSLRPLADAPNEAWKVAAYTVTTPWSEATTTYNNFLPANGYVTPAFRTVPFSGLDTVRFDVTQPMIDWWSGALPNRGILLGHVSNGFQNTPSFTAGSSESTRKPVLDICYLPSVCSGKVEGSACADAAACTINGTCQSGVCVGSPASSKTVCRASAGTCDSREYCTGTTTKCPADKIAPAGTSCRSSAGLCDIDEVCDGAVKECPVDKVLAVGTSCRPSVGECDPAEVCNGSTGVCPADTKASSGQACSDDGNPCTSDTCDGAADTCQHPIGNAGAVCRAAAGVCDVPEVCTGASASCPVDTKVPNNQACPDDGNPCTKDVCNGSAAACQHPAGNSGVACPDDGNPCTKDVCDGAAAACSHPAGNAGAACDQNNAVCSTNACDGTSTVCQHHAGNAGTVCRAKMDACDYADYCDGSNPNCPPNGWMADGTACNGSGTCHTGQCNVSSPSNCGHLTETCCPGSTCVTSDLGCKEAGNYCTKCGGLGAPCCPGSNCNPGYVCADFDGNGNTCGPAQQP
jgi:hypothetical protein